MAKPTKIDAATAVLDRFGHSKGKSNTYAFLSGLSGVPETTLWHRDHGRKSIQHKAAKQQYLTSQEEKALLNYLLRMSANGYPLPVKFVRTLALVIMRRRATLFQIPSADEEDIRPPGRTGHKPSTNATPSSKLCELKLIGKELDHPEIFPENIYNMDETGVLLSVLNSLKVLVSKSEFRNYRGAGVKRTLITAIECIAADGRYLHPLIIWPAATHRSTWTVHPTPGWHFAHSTTGYTDTAISLYWIQHVFDPQTKARAKGHPRILINDGFGTHEFLEIMKFCYENNIILCRLLSHTSYKPQPCDVGIFGPLKTAYREEVERLYRGGSNMIGKQHFTLLYDRARCKAFSSCNIISGWSKAGLRPFNSERVLKDIQKPEIQIDPKIIKSELHGDITQLQQLETPKTSENLMSLRRKIDENIGHVGGFDGPCRLYLEKLGNAAENAFADRAILLDENLLLFEQNNEKATRKSMKATVVGSARVLSYEDIVEAQKQRDVKEAAAEEVRDRRRSKRKPTTQVLGKRSRSQEVEEARREIEASGMQEYCSVL